MACAFWRAHALVTVSRIAEAREPLVALALVPNELALMAKMAVPGTGDLIGNVPPGAEPLVVHPDLVRRPRRRATVARRRSRPVEIVWICRGAALLLKPRCALADANHLRIDSQAQIVTRILGARQLTQGVLSGLRPRSEVLALGFGSTPCTL